LRKSYLTYFFKQIREGNLIVIPKTIYRYFGTLYSRKKQYSIVGPLHGSIIGTYRCNLRCSMCELWKKTSEYKKMGKQELTTEEMKAVINDYASIGTAGIGFSGGEPLLRQDMLELITYAKKKGMVTHLSSNGMIINTNLAKKIMESGLDAIGFSLDGATAETHDGIRGAKGSYDKVIKAIGIFNELNKIRKRKIVIVVVTVISALNLDEIINLVYLLKKVGVDKISFIPFHDIGILSDGIPTMIKHKIKLKELKKLDKLIDDLIEIKKKEEIIDSSGDYLRLFKYCFRDKPLPITCYAGYATFSVDSYGDMYPCFPILQMGLTKNIANVRDISLKDYWKSKELKEMRNKIKDCRKCYWNNHTEINLLFNWQKIENIE